MSRVRDDATLAARLAGLPVQEVLGIAVPVAADMRARLLGLALLDRERAGSGLWIPRCRSVHTFGMRFDLDVVFVDRSGLPLRRVDRLGPSRLAYCRGAYGVLEAPARG